MNGARWREQVRYWTGACLAATVFFALVFSLRGLRPIASLPSPEPIRFRFLPVAAGSAAAESRKVWSPVLFSFPSEAGFGRGGEGLALVRPPLQAPVPEPVFLRAPHAGSWDPPLAAGRPDGGRGSDRFQDRVRVDVPVRFLAAAPSSRWMIAFSNRWTVNAFRARPWPVDAAGDRAWEARVYLAFSADGQPAHVLVQSVSIPEVAGVVARTLRSWRLTENAVDREGLVRIRYEPNGNGEEN